MKHFTFYFASLDNTPTKDCEKLPEFANDPNVTYIHCDADDAVSARKFLMKEARKSGFTYDNYMSMLVEAMTFDERIATIKKVLAGLSDEDSLNILTSVVGGQLEK